MTRIFFERAGGGPASSRFGRLTAGEAGYNGAPSPEGRDKIAPLRERRGSANPTHPTHPSYPTYSESQQLRVCP
jgi:hypothetical protein